MINISTKKLTISVITFLSALFTLIALAFPLIKADDGLSYSGFDFLSAKKVAEFVNLGVISASVYFYIQLFAALALVIISIATLFNIDEKLSKILEFVCVILGVVFTFIYMIWGVLYVNVLNVGAGYNVCSTLSFLPFIFNMLFLIGYFVAKFYFKNKEEGSKAQPAAAEVQPAADETQSVSE